ncbi:hypothetical protein EMIT0P74_60215 [Pseudomonas sp. IT-P74]
MGQAVAVGGFVEVDGVGHGDFQNLRETFMVQACAADFQSDEDHCRSELARDKPESAAGHLPTNVIVDDHRERARSYRVLRSSCEFPSTISR